jgi:hypothetical protein
MFVCNHGVHLVAVQDASKRGVRFGLASDLTETKMRKTVLTILGALLMAGSVVQIASATDGVSSTTGHHMRKTYWTHTAANERFLNANNASESRASASCHDREPGNPYNPQTDYTGWSSWRESGAWDSRNDCW